MCKKKKKKMQKTPQQFGNADVFGISPQTLWTLPRTELKTNTHFGCRPQCSSNLLQEYLEGCVYLFSMLRK